MDIKKSLGRTRTSIDVVDRLRRSSFRRPKKSTARRSLELGIPKTTVQNVLHNRLDCTFTKSSLKMKLPNKQIFFFFFSSSDEAIFYIISCVNIGGECNQPNEIVQYDRDSPNINVRCRIMRDRVMGRYMVAEETTKGVTYLDMHELYIFPQIDEEGKKKKYHFSTRWSVTPLQFQCKRSFEYQVSWLFDWREWPCFLAT